MIITWRVAKRLTNIAHHPPSYGRRFEHKFKYIISINTTVCIQTMKKCVSMDERDFSDQAFER
jgi:hypothetical protein